MPDRVPSFRTSGWRLWPHAVCLEELRRIGFGAVELCLEHPDVAPRAMTAERCREVAGELGGLSVSALSFHGKREHPRLKAEYTHMLVDVGARLRAAGVATDVLVICGGLRDYAGLVALLRDVCPRAQDAGFLLAVEPEPGTVVHGSADMRRLLDDVDHPALRVNLDVGHSFLTEPDVVADIALWGPLIAGVHVEGMPAGVHRHLVPGEGDLDLPAALRAIDRAGYTRPLTIDLFDIQDDPPGWSERAYLGLQAVIAAELELGGLTVRG